MARRFDEPMHDTGCEHADDWACRGSTDLLELGYSLVVVSVAPRVRPARGER